MFTVLAILFGVLFAYRFNSLLQKAKTYLSKEVLARITMIAHVLTALAAINLVLSYARPIAMRVAAFLSDCVGVFIVKYLGESLHCIAGYLGNIARVLFNYGFDYAAFPPPANPAWQAVAVVLFTQMLVFEFLSRQKR